VSITDDQTIVRKKAPKAEHHAELLKAVGEFNGGLPSSLAAILASLADTPAHSDPASVEHARILAVVEGTRIVPLGEAARLLGISKSTIKRSFSHPLVRIGERRVGMRLKDIWELAKPA
jgi:hypothetical protein